VVTILIFDLTSLHTTTLGQALHAFALLCREMRRLPGVSNGRGGKIDAP